jgi:putative FmdB family regulatory protein
MPLYEYVCSTCRNRFEKLRPMSTALDGAACPDCGSHSHRALSVFASFVRGTVVDEMVPVGGGGCGGCGGNCACAAG